MPKRMIVGISGASGIPVGIALLKAVRDMPDWETHLILSEGAQRALKHETPLTMEEIGALATRRYDPGDGEAPVAGGAFRTEGMAIVPCSMKTLAGVACGYADNLLLRAADVCLKERRPLVLGVRETPLHALHLENMLRAARLGAVIMPLMMGFYFRPEHVEDMTRQLVGKIMDVFGLDLPGFRRWGEEVSLS